jgi:hypothetical protein
LPQINIEFGGRVDSFLVRNTAGWHPDGRETPAGTISYVIVLIDMHDL